MNLLNPEPLADHKVTYERTPYAACPICDHKYFQEIKRASCTGHALYRSGLPKEMVWVKCGGCGHVFTDGFFEGKALEYLFGTTQQSQIPGYNIEQGRYTAADMVERIIAGSGLRQGNWLDIGFGAGHLLTTAQEYGFHVTGVDLRESSCEPLRKLRYDVRSEPFTDLDPEYAKFDIISMADVLEHIPYPVPALRHAHALLKSGGSLFVSCPNTDSFVWKALDIANQNPFWAELEHLHNFGYQELKRLLNETGFKTVQYNVSRRYRACMEVIAVRQ